MAFDRKPAITLADDLQSFGNILSCDRLQDTSWLECGLLDRPKSRYRGIVSLGLWQAYGISQSFSEPVALVTLVTYSRSEFIRVSHTHVEPSTPVATESPRTQAG